MAFTFKKRQLEHLVLCGNPLPCVDNCKLLGNYIKNKYDGIKRDQWIKQAQFITKNNELEQEFYFCHPQTKFVVNKIYNSHFTGSPLWNLFCSEATKGESTWNRSIKIMNDLLYENHGRVMEPISENQYVRKILLQKFIYFADQIKKSTKSVINLLFITIKHSMRNTTGQNL